MDLIQNAINKGFHPENEKYYLWEIQKWLREKYEIHIEINTGEFYKTETDTAFWFLDISIIGASDSTYIENDFEGTYEQALEEVLKKALKLIKNK